ncbi:MAG: gliding motility-associated C-terminal domain-containing protein [Saprospiraceae bacterium]|nr:gliding motility-associated C-terminal domain-containing protein [Saprospiraceae bacterium]
MINTTISFQHHLRWVLFFSIMLCGISLSATHNRAGEITYEQIGPTTIRMKLTTYTKTSSVAADRDSVEIFWGDGTSQWVVRSNGKGDPLPNDIKRNFYIADHTYPGRARYTITFRDLNRVGNILNVNYPNSIDIPLALSTSFTLLDPQFQGVNNSVQLLQPPIDFACLGEKFIHNPNAYDPDGDSLSYEMTMPLENFDKVVPNYLFPDQILPGPGNQIYLNPVTGDFVWDSPPQAGEYNIAIKINEYRGGVLINTVIRDMQILVRPCQNEPPVIEAPDRICVIAGEKISLPIYLSDPDVNQRLLLTATGAPLDQGKANVIGANAYSDQPFTALLEWQTDCNDIAVNDYKIVLRAVDNYFGDTSGLATLKTLLIKVVGPPPENLMVEARGNAAELSWDLPYACEDTDDNYFFGFSIWRSNKSVALPMDTCNPSISGYQRIVYNTKATANGRYFHRDENLDPNGVYCYRIVAEFTKYTSTGNPYNLVRSIPSEEECFTFSRNLPLLTEVSVNETSQSGSINIAFQKPDPSVLDTLLYPGPYTIEILRRTVGTGIYLAIPAGRKNFTNLTVFSDTTFLDTGINTVSTGYEYQLEFYSGSNLIGRTSSSSSVFSLAIPSDKRVLLSWNDNTAWTNSKYYIYKENPSGVFELLDSTTEKRYTEFDLINGQNYCYKVESYGSYGLEDVKDPLLNFSQEVCAQPVDNLAPCAPQITVTNLCDQLDLVGIDALENTVEWSDANQSCDEFQDILQYNIYYSPDSSNNFVRIGISPGNAPRKFVHNDLSSGLQGCYAVTAVDLQGNESVLSNFVCVENCPLYVLPNTFTPNGDGSNDVFKPIKNYFIASVEMKIFNDWGNLIFETTDPAINWTAENVATGTYYYTCRVFRESLNGGVVADEKPLKGFINLVR